MLKCPCGPKFNRQSRVKFFELFFSVYIIDINETIVKSYEDILINNSCRKRFLIFRKKLFV